MQFCFYTTDKYIFILFKIIQSKKIEGGTESVKLQSALRGQSVEPWLQSQIWIPFTLPFLECYYLGSTLYNILIILINK